MITAHTPFHQPFLCQIPACNLQGRFCFWSEKKKAKRQLKSETAPHSHIHLRFQKWSSRSAVRYVVLLFSIKPKLLLAYFSLSERSLKLGWVPSKTYAIIFISALFYFMTDLHNSFHYLHP